jgi:hypothetical protein
VRACLAIIDRRKVTEYLLRHRVDDDQTEYGPKYRIRGTLSGPNGRTLRVLSIWMKEDATGGVKFVTLRPDKS